MVVNIPSAKGKSSPDPPLGSVKVEKVPVKVKIEGKKIKLEKFSVCEEISNLIFALMCMAFFCILIYMFLVLAPSLYGMGLMSRWPIRAAAPVLVHSACGGVIEVDGNEKVAISYRKGIVYGKNERCAWIVSSFTGKASLTFLPDNFIGYPFRDGCIVAELDENGEGMSCRKWNTTFDSSLTVKTPAVIYFTSRNLTYFQGFEIEILAAPNGRLRYMFEQVETMHVSKRKYGSFPFDTIEQRRNSLLGRVTVFQPPPYDSLSSSYYKRKRTFTVTPTKSKECRDYIVAYRIPEYSRCSSYCYLNEELTRSKSSFSTDDAVVVLNWAHAPGNNTNCALDWKEDQSSGRSSSFDDY